MVHCETREDVAGDRRRSLEADGRRGLRDPVERTRVQEGARALLHRRTGRRTNSLSASARRRLARYSPHQDTVSAADGGRLPSITLVPHKVSTRITDPIVSPLAAAGVTPNMISVAGFGGNVAAGALAAGGHFLWAGAVMLVFSALDLLDGALARKTGTVTKFGAVFDSVLDRVSEAAVLGGVLFHYTEAGGHTQEIVLCYVAIVGSIMVSYVRARAEGIGPDAARGAVHAGGAGDPARRGAGYRPWRCALGALAARRYVTYDGRPARLHRVAAHVGRRGHLADEHARDPGTRAAHHPGALRRRTGGRVRIDYFTQRKSAIVVPGRAECRYCEEVGAGSPRDRGAARADRADRPRVRRVAGRGREAGREARAVHRPPGTGESCAPLLRAAGRASVRELHRHDHYVVAGGCHDRARRLRGIEEAARARRESACSLRPRASTVQSSRTRRSGWRWCRRT